MHLLFKVKLKLDMKQDSKAEYIVLAVLVIPIIWLGLLSAPYMYKGLFGIIANLSNVLNKPFSIVWCSDTPRTVFIFLLIYFIGICIYLSTNPQ